MKVQPRKLPDKDRMRYVDALYTAAGSLRGRKDMKAFLHDLLTESERVMLGRRIVIAQLLLEGREYDEIISMLHVGNDTIWRVHRWLDEKYPGYRKAIEGMKEEMETRKLGPIFMSRLKKKYPLHFLLFR